MASRFKFVLDEHMRPFPGLPMTDLLGFDLETLRDFDSRFVNTATPDWVIYFAAATREYTGVITHDHSQLLQENEARALERTQIVVITYRKGQADEVTKWGLLLAYSRRILRRLEQGDRGAYLLPNPGNIEVQSAGALLRDLERHQRGSLREIRQRADREMRGELDRRELSNLWVEGEDS